MIIGALLALSCYNKTKSFIKVKMIMHCCSMCIYVHACTYIVYVWQGASTGICILKNKTVTIGLIIGEGACISKIYAKGWNEVIIENF